MSSLALQRGGHCIYDMNTRGSILMNQNDTDTYRKTDDGTGILNERISFAIDGYQQITLEELKNSDASLMSRKESKYLMTFDQCLELISGLDGDYMVLDVDECRMSGYETEYYDDDSFTSYHQHHNGKANRYKLRARHYLSSDEYYIEVKEKKNTGVTVKNRIGISESSDMSEEEYDRFLRMSFPYDYHEFHPVISVEYKRVTLVSKKMNERITLDFDLTFKNSEKTYSFPAVVIGEVKMDKSITSSKALTYIRTLGIRERSFSKYCIGVSLIYSHLKHNRFKPNLLFLSRISGSEAIC